jgi:hypothetical protein
MKNYLLTALAAVLFGGFVAWLFRPPRRNK